MASKRNLVVLLIMPFVVALLSFNALKTTFNLIENDIIGISWDYDDNEMFILSNDKYKYPLEAKALSDSRYETISKLNWSVQNTDGVGIAHAEIINENGKNYLHTLSEGEVMISVSNVKGNIHKSMNATIFLNNMIVFNSSVKGSQSNIDSNVYYGQYDFNDNNKVLSNISYKTKAVFEGANAEAEIISSSDNVTYSNSNNLISFKNNISNPVEDAYVELGFKGMSSLETFRYNFKIVKDGINVYTYDDLLKCTNKSNDGEIVVLRKNLESKANLTLMDNSNSVLFGKENNSFEDDIYKFETRFNRNYIDQWNNFASLSNGQYKSISSQVNVGIHIQKDFYGNGFTINMHDLTYPYGVVDVYDQTGNIHQVPVLKEENIFKGPLVYYSLGDPNGTPLAKAYGQDNIGMYVEGSDITINDVRVKNCDFGDNLFNLEYTGTVMEVYGNNITIKNSVLSSGKTVLKVYDSNNVLLDNSLLTYSRNFLLSTGSYQYLTVKDSEDSNYLTQSGEVINTSINNFLTKDHEGDLSLTNYTVGSSITDKLLQSIKSIQNGLDNNSVQNLYKGDLTIKDSLFYQSGIASIALESLFNGPFLYNASPSKVTSVLSNHSSEFEQQGLGIPFIPTNVGGTSYPVKLTLSGNTQFFDYKTSDFLDLGGLVQENVSTVPQIFGTTEEITLDKIFPVKNILMKKANEKNALYNNKVNVPIAYYGGGLNLSTLTYDDSFSFQSHLLDEIDVDFVSEYASTPNISNDVLTRVLLKCVTLVSGFNSFKFVISNGDGYLYDEYPSIQSLINNS